MRATKPLLGETTNRDEAFPEFASIDLTVEQDPFQMYSSHTTTRVRRYTKATVPRWLRCLNPRCQQGGLDLQNFISFWPPGKQTFHCDGHEGTPKGRRKGAPCGNSFVLTLSTETKRSAE